MTLYNLVQCHGPIAVIAVTVASTLDFQLAMELLSFVYPFTELAAHEIKCYSLTENFHLTKMV